MSKNGEFLTGPLDPDHNRTILMFMRPQDDKLCFQDQSHLYGFKESTEETEKQLEDLAKCLSKVICSIAGLEPSRINSFVAKHGSSSVTMLTRCPNITESWILE